MNAGAAPNRRSAAGKPAADVAKLHPLQRWLIEPAAEQNDSRWQGRPIWQLAVTAESPAFARRIAEHWALATEPLVHIGNESTSENAGFEDEKLYRVRAFPEGGDVVGNSAREHDVLVLAGPVPSSAKS